MEITWSVIISAIALLVSVLSAPLTTFLNNRHQLKMRNIEFYQEHRAEAIETFIRTAGAAIRVQTNETMRDYGQAYGEMFLYAPHELWDDIIALNKEIMNFDDFQKTYVKFAELCKALSEHSPRKVKQRRNR